ncbi:hypothetical protein MMC08_005688 [Hypocenomyce scalaris]|nr:hypothetical protein [Hypocenomyce scalaris]
MEVPATMRAATVVAYKEPLVILDDVKVPEVSAGKLLVKVEAAGLCSSDLGAQEGKMPYLTELPFCGGHESAGIIVKIGPGENEFAVGDRVQGYKGSWGGFSEYCLVQSQSTVKVPDDLSLDVAAPLSCAGVTAYSALLKVRTKAGRLVNIVGCGGVGHVAIMFAKAMGYRVHAYDVAEEKLKLAKKCGADEAYNITDTSKTYEKATTTIVITGVNAAYQSALGLTANHGAVVAVGLTTVEVSVPLWASRDIQLLPTSMGSKVELAECLDLAARKNIKPVIEIRHIDNINEGYQELAAGKIEGRYVYRFH